MRTSIITVVLLVRVPRASEPVYTPIPLQGRSLAAVESGYLRLPAGVPMGGTSRRRLWRGAYSLRDLRKSNWTSEFHPSAGQVTGVPLQTLWVTNGDRHMVVLRVDLIAAFDGLVFEIERRLSSILGEDLSGQVAMVTSHSHSSPAAHHRAPSRSGLTAMTRVSLSASWIRRSIRRCARTVGSLPLSSAWV